MFSQGNLRSQLPTFYVSGLVSLNSFLWFSAHTLGSLSPGEDYTFALVAVKFGEKSATVELDGNTSM